MVIREGNDSIEIRPTEQVPDHLPSAGDVRLAIAVRSQGLAGEGWAWIEAPRLRLFIEHLRQLEAQRKGSAEVESISPGQFRLRVYATDRVGHVAIAGRLARGEQALEFGFGFCPSLLPRVVAGFDAIAEGRAEQVPSVDQPRE
jgi:hypothetical protein